MNANSLGLFVVVFVAMVFATSQAQEVQHTAGATSYATLSDPETIVLDARQAGRGVMYSQMTIPVKPGPFTFVYPKWIPGEHGPTGPLNDISMVSVTAAGRALPWNRDQVDLYAFHIDVPQSVTKINVDFVVLLNAPNDTMSTANLAIVNWNRDLFYQDDTNQREVFVKPSIILPQGWEYGSALPGAKQSGDRIDFDTVTLEMLVDTPLDMGRYAKHVVLWKGDGTYQVLDAFADRPQDLDFSSSILTPYENIVPETFALYGSRHWNVYHLLLALSDKVGYEGIEHHQSSDNRAPDDFMTNENQQLFSGDLLTHEFSHSWNGKYRRPFDLFQANFQIPERTELLWVYEGMNQYLGDLISFRSGIRKPQDYPEYLASIYDDMDHETGRSRTSLIELTTGAPYFFNARGDYGSMRRNANDFYTEGELIWLDADTIIREKSGGKKSLDTFLQLFTAPSLTGPMVVPYTRSDVEGLLDRVQPYDWHDFFQRYVYNIVEHPPSDDFARAGWKLVYTDKTNKFIEAYSSYRPYVSAWDGIGMDVQQSGTISVRFGSPAWEAGLGDGMKLISVNGQSFSLDVLKYALKQSAHSTSPNTFIADQGGWMSSYTVVYHGGLLYPHLVRIPATPDMFAAIMEPHRPGKAAKPR